MDWFNIAKGKLLKNVNEFKEKLKKRIIKEEITERQWKKIESIYDSNKFESNF